jgi:3-oxoacid CoA-transferase subunit B
MQHVDKSGDKKLLKKCTLPLTGKKCVHQIVSDYGVFDVTPKGFLLKEYAPGLTPEEVVKATDGFVEISPLVKQMSF